MPAPRYFDVNSLTSGTIKSGDGFLHRVIINDNFPTSLVLVDSTDPNSTTFIAEKINVSSQRTLEFQCHFQNGLSFKFNGPHGCSITIVYE